MGITGQNVCSVNSTEVFGPILQISGVSANNNNVA